MKLYKNILSDFEKMSLGHSTIGIIASSCLGSVAAMFILESGHSFLYMFELFLVVSVCMGFNAVVLLQLRPKIILNTLILSLVVSTIFILLNIF
ncbi:hypothetical protein SAMN05444483_102277 [Salegentibacter echinorum]|uniref:Uncharacterized protein n=1 Tax=Salegentibacter echinorum TaxID=1073325 RepID=A0A1M5E8S4_SALEC|nr:hypothetical protein [Salegentibacter echinorum]SHF75607.1 hypothetical protein SAMN05444483_102277 [Salegentibacter echinorum]